MTGLVLHLALVGLLALVVSMAMAPMEALGWWAGWLGPADDPRTPAPAAPPAEAPPRQPAAFVVFLSGIGSISGDELLPQESAFLDRLQRAVPDVAIVRDVFPYAPSGRALLTGQRVFAWLWRRVLRWRLSGTRLLPAILNLRNLFQVLVSADHRYGPLYGLGIARIAADRLRAGGWTPGTPVILLGSSGGGQVAIGAATYLAAETGAPLAVVTFGGVMSSDRGIASMSSLTSLYGTGDRVYALGRLAFAGRWPAAVGSFWNVALRDGRLRERAIGPIGHSGRDGYLAPGPRPDGGAPFLEVTVREVGQAVRDLLRPSG